MQAPLGMMQAEGLATVKEEQGEEDAAVSQSHRHVLGWITAQNVSNTADTFRMLCKRALGVVLQAFELKPQLSNAEGRQHRSGGETSNTPPKVDDFSTLNPLQCLIHHSHHSWTSIQGIGMQEGQSGTSSCKQPGTPELPVWWFHSALRDEKWILTLEDQSMSTWLGPFIGFAALIKGRCRWAGVLLWSWWYKPQANRAGVLVTCDQKSVEGGRASQHSKGTQQILYPLGQQENGRRPA
jgi:hypothetical protein